MGAQELLPERLSTGRGPEPSAPSSMFKRCRQIVGVMDSRFRLSRFPTGPPAGDRSRHRQLWRCSPDIIAMTYLTRSQVPSVQFN